MEHDPKVVLHWKGGLYRPSNTTVHVWSDHPELNMLVSFIGEKDTEPKIELIDEDGVKLFHASSFTVVPHETVKPSVAVWYELEIGRLASQLTVETQEFLDYE